VSLNDEARQRLELVVEEIAQMHGGEVDRQEMADGTWIVTIERDGEMIAKGEGMSLAMALSDLVADARANGRI
jgi:hypothetical protein